MRWDAIDKVPLFSAIPACAGQDTESSDDFLSGRVMRRALNMPATAADCTQDGTKGALALTRERMTSIAEKIRTRAALTAEERQFVANVRTLPVYRMLEWGDRAKVTAGIRQHPAIGNAEPEDFAAIGPHPMRHLERTAVLNGLESIEHVARQDRSHRQFSDGGKNVGLEPTLDHTRVAFGPSRSLGKHPFLGQLAERRPLGLILIFSLSLDVSRIISR